MAFSLRILCLVGGEIDWAFLDEISSVTEIRPRHHDDEERKNFVLDESAWVDSVVMPWYRSQDQPQVCFLHLCQIFGFKKMERIEMYVFYRSVCFSTSTLPRFAPRSARGANSLTRISIPSRDIICASTRYKSRIWTSRFWMWILRLLG